MNKLLLLSLIAVTTSSVVAAPKVSKSIAQPDRHSVAGSMILNAEGIELIYPQTTVLDTVVTTPVDEKKEITGVETDLEDLQK